MLIPSLSHYCASKRTQEPDIYKGPGEFGEEKDTPHPYHHATRILMEETEL